MGINHVSRSCVERLLTNWVEQFPKMHCKILPLLAIRCLTNKQAPSNGHGAYKQSNTHTHTDAHPYWWNDDSSQASFSHKHTHTDLECVYCCAVDHRVSLMHKERNTNKSEYPLSLNTDFYLHRSLYLPVFSSSLQNKGLFLKKQLWHLHTSNIKSTFCMPSPRLCIYLHVKSNWN